MDKVDYLMEMKARYASVKQDLLYHLPQQQELNDGLEAELQKVRLRWRQEHQDTYDLIDNLIAETGRVEQELREAMVEAFDGENKQLAPGLSIRLKTKLKYDHDKALEFAKSSGVCLTLDTKAFEKVAPTLCPDLVTEEVTIVPVISLSKEGQ